MSTTLDGELAASSTRSTAVSVGLEIGKGASAGFRRRERGRRLHQFRIVAAALAASSRACRSSTGSPPGRQAHRRHQRCRLRAIADAGTTSTLGMHLRSREREMRRHQLRIKFAALTASSWALCPATGADPDRQGHRRHQRWRRRAAAAASGIPASARGLEGLGPGPARGRLISSRASATVAQNGACAPKAKSSAHWVSSAAATLHVIVAAWIAPAPCHVAGSVSPSHV